MIHFKYIYNIVLAAILAFTGSSAQAQIVLGYCGDKIATSGLSNNNLNTEISCAMVLPPDKLTEYTICSVSEIQVGFSAVEGLNSLKVWVRHHLNGENLAMAEVSVSDLTEGWNTIQLPETVAISGEDSLFCGYSYTQSEIVKCISYNGAKKTKNSFFISNGTMWGDYTKNYGPVSIRAVVMPLNDNAIKLTDIRLNKRSQLYQGANASYEPITITGTIQNLGQQALHSFIVSDTDNGQPAEEAVFQIDGEGISFGETTTFSYELMPGTNVMAPARDIPINVSVKNQNNDATAILIDCEQTLYYELGSCSFMGDVADYIIEEFTSEECGYAPIGQQRLREAVEEAHRINLGDHYQDWQNGELDGYYVNYTIISRHEGYGPADPWRVSRGSDYTPAIFGPKELTFAPAMTINRSHIPVSTTLSTDSLAQIIASYHQPNEVSLMCEDITCDEASRKLSVKVNAYLWSSAFCANPNIILCAKQDKTASIEQKNYYPERYDSDYQLDAICCFLTCTSGSSKLYPKADMEAIMAGKEPISNYLQLDAYGNAYCTFTFEGTLPNDIQTLDGITLVGYIADETPGGKIYGAFSHGLSK